MKFKNEFKQQAYEKFIEKKGDLYENINSPSFLGDFKASWNKSLKIAKSLFFIHKGDEQYRQFSKNADIILEENLDYGNSLLKSFMDIENSNLTFTEKIQHAFNDSASKRFENFLNVHANDTYEKNGIKQTLIEWFYEFRLGNITKDEYYDIIKDFKKSNPDKMTYSGKIDENEYMEK